MYFSYLPLQVFTQKTAGFRQFMKEKPQLDLTKVVLSPMPGVVKGVSVEVGQMVGEGHECCIVEAMKMQNSMKATVTSKVKAIHVSGLAINSFFFFIFLQLRLRISLKKRSNILPCPYVSVAESKL